MTIYLGSQGHVELQRQGTRGENDERVALYTAIEPDDVNVNAKRFSFLGSQLGVITGDRIEISTTSGDDLQLVDGHNFPDWLGFIHVDAIGGIRLFKDFDQAIDGSKDNAIALTQPSKLQHLEIVSRDNKSRCISQVRSYSLTTQRETVDVTGLSQQYRNQYHQGLISGQGQMDCFWEHTRDVCEASCGIIDYSAYLSFLCIRLEQGAAFRGRFYIFDGGTSERSVWYECQAVITSVVVNVEPNQIIGTTVDFITTGPIRLQTGIRPSYLVQEQDADGYVLSEGGDPTEVAYAD